MAELGVAASAIAVVQISASVASLCNQYFQDVRHARTEISRLREQVNQLQTTTNGVHDLLKGTDGAKFKTSRQLLKATSDAHSQLEELLKKLQPKTAREAIRRIGIRSLKWPFESKDVNQMVMDLARCSANISSALQVDQTTILLDIHKGVKQLELQSTEDASISRKPHRMVPFPSNPDFIHRPIIEQWIRDRYRQAGQRMALVGMGGFGKSQLAIEFAHYVYASEAGTSVFWVHGNNKATFEESYRALADYLVLPRRYEPNINVLALVRDWLQKDDTSPWLMVVDNADDKKVFFPDRGDDDAWQDSLSSYLPKSTIGQILVTSRSLDVAEKLVGDSRAILQIPVMGEGQALELFRNKIDSEVNEAAAIDLILALDCIPLAVSQAAAYINRRSPRMTTASYLDEFRKGSKRKDSLLRSDKGDLGRQNEVSNSVMVTWQVTFEQIRRERPGAACLLSLMSQFQAQNIPENMLYSYDDETTAKDEDEQESTDTKSLSDGCSMTGHFEDDLDVLQGYSLVSQSMEGLFEMHSLVQFCTRSWISEFGDPTRWSKLFIRLAADHFPSGAFETWGICRNLLPHVEPTLSRHPRGQYDLLQWAELLTNVSWYMLMIGEYVRAAVLSRQATRTRTKVLGSDHPLTLKSMAYLASTFRQQGRWEEAEKLEVEVMKTRKVKFGADYPNMLNSMTNLAATFQKQGRWEEAKTLQVEVMQMSEAKLGEEHPDTLTSMGNLAATFRKQGRWEEAEKLGARVMGTLKAKLGADHPSTLNSMANLAATFRKQGRWEEAEKLGVEVMETRKVRLGAAHPSTLTSMASLASTFSDQGRWKEAEGLEVEVSETRKAKLGVNHPDTLTSMANLARTLWYQGRWEEAEKLEVEVMETSKVQLGVNHPDTLTSMANLASTFSDQGRWKEAEKLEVEVMETRKANLGANHPETLTSMANLASTFSDQGRWKEAEKLEVEVMETSKVQLGVNHPDTLTSMANLARTLWYQSRWEEAEKLQVEVIETSEAKLGAEHPDTLASMADLASTFWSQGRCAEAEKLQVEVMEARKAKLGADHPDTLRSMDNLAFTWHDQGHQEKALNLMQSCVWLRRKKLGHTHPDTQLSVAALQSWQNAAHTIPGR